MRFQIASTFTDSLGDLDPQELARAKRAAFDFQVNPQHPGFKFHRVKRSRDKNFWTFRAGLDVRVVVHVTKDTFTLCYAGHHDDAYAWAERRRFEVHPTTGAIQIVQVQERVEEVVQRVTTEPPVFAGYEIDYLLALGIPVEWVDWIRSATLDQYLEAADRLPEEAAERLMDLAAGEPVPIPQPTVPAPDPFSHPDSQRRFRTYTDLDSLQKALEAPWESWLVFLHPLQHEIVERDFSGAAKVFGSAGTGKTVVALHRTARLARANPGSRVLLTTFTTTLAARLEGYLDLLMGADSPERGQVTIQNIHGVARDVQKRAGRPFQAIRDKDLLNVLSQHPVEGFSTEFLFAEWKAIIDPMNLRAWKDYRSAPRRGRGKALGGRQKRKLWTAFEAVFAHMKARGLSTWAGLCHEAVAALEAHPEWRFDHVVADEGQDFSFGELRFLRSLVQEGANDVFLSSDAGQRIYPGRFSWSEAGIKVRGRSKRLKINYRTSEQIRRFSDKLLPRRMRDADGNEEDRLARSLFAGPEPEVHGCESHQEEIEALATWLERCLTDGLAPEDIAIFTRTASVRSKRALQAVQKLGLSWQVLQSSTAITRDGVCLGTMHSAKGLEFKAVAVVGCDHGLLPLAIALENAVDAGDQDAIREQERNLLYVACTRARDRLFVSYTGEPSEYLKAPSPVPPPTPQVSPQPQKERRPQPATPFSISPSKVARYFYHGCERFLRYRATRKTARFLADAVPDTQSEHSELSEAIMKSGYLWEEQVLTTSLRGRVLIAEGDGPLYERRFDLEDSRALLRDAAPGQFIYQATLRAPQSFYDTYNLDRTFVSVSDNHPDLIEVLEDEGGGRLLRVLDMKRGGSLRSTHRIQILFYALELAAIVQDEGIEHTRVDLDVGAVWLGGHEEPAECGLDEIRPHLEIFLREGLTPLLTAPPEQVRWHVQSRCEWCPYFAHCWDEMQRTNDVSRIAYLTHHGKDFLWDQGVRNLGELRGFLKTGEAADEVLNQCASLSGQRLRLTTKVESLLRQEVSLHGSASLALPRATRDEISVFLTLQQEPLGGSLYLAGMKVSAGPEVPRRITHKRGRDDQRLFLAERPEETERVKRQLVVELHTLLQRIDAYNLACEWSDKLRLQVYVYSNLEHELLINTLMETLEDPELADAAMDLLFHFQGPELILVEDHPEDHVAYPVVALLTVISALLAVPVDVSYTLPETLGALGSDHVFPRHEAFHFPLGHALRSETIFDVWYRGQSEHLDALRVHGHAYLDAIHAAMDALRIHANREIYAWAPRFQLPELFPVRDPFLSRLIFLTRYESFLRFGQMRAVRLAARDEVQFNREIIELEATGEDTLCVLGEPVDGLEASTFASWLLVPDHVEGRRAQIRYPDYHYRSRPWAATPSPHRAVVSLPEVHLDDSELAVGVTIKLASNRSPFKLQVGEPYLLYRRFSDFTTDKVVDFLASLEGRSLELRNMLESGEPTQMPLDEPVRGAVEEGEALLGLTPSQRDAYRAVRELRTVAVWGPPGTGKTHFLASMILGLVRAHKKVGRPFRVVITAFTHSAIENLMGKLAELDDGSGIKLGKANGWKGEKLGLNINPKGFASWMARQPYGVAGATVYQLIKDPDLKDVDLVLVDEASQMEVPKAMIPASLVGEVGRLVFAGDHLQLPPIIAGSYPEPEEGEPVLHRSIFEALMDVEGAVRQLLENFRMNDVLTSYAAKLLYGPGYRCSNDEVAKRRLALGALPEDTDALVKACLAPSHPLVMVVLDGIVAARENLPEAELVARLVCALREGLSYEDDETFFSQGVFVVSPHHAQNRLIRRALGERRGWSSKPFVDTVDKMQGQEADAVIVSYGVSDAEYAEQEAAFIYSLNRLNVSITRGRSKTILCLPRPLLEATPQILENPSAAEGLAYMRRLFQAIEAQGDTESFILGGGVTADVYRTNATWNRDATSLPSAGAWAIPVMASD